MARYRIAGLTVEMQASGRTARQAAAYAVPAGAPPDLSITCGPARVWEANPALESLDDAEYMGTGAAFARGLLDFGGLQLHASAVALEGRAWLFSGPCGVGKSTHAEKWMRLFGAAMLNDDKPALRRVDGTWYACGTPWSGKYDKSAPLDVPLGGLCFLRRGGERTARRLTPEEALPLLLSQTTRRLDPARTDKLLALADLLLREAALWQLTCTHSDAAAYTARAALCGEDGP